MNKAHALNKSDKTQRQTPGPKSVDPIDHTITSVYVKL